MITAQEAFIKAQEANQRARELQVEANQKQLKEIEDIIKNTYEKRQFEFTYEGPIHLDVKNILEQNGYSLKNVQVGYNEPGVKISFKNPTN